MWSSTIRIPSFGQLFGCYMPDQIFYTMEEVPDLEELVGKRVWYFQCFRTSAGGIG